MHLSVVIPAYNEEKRIGKTLEAVCEYLKKQSYAYEVIAVSDGSTDQTVTIVQDFAGHLPQLRLVQYQENKGKGYAVKCGMLEAAGELRLFMDADNATSIEQLDKLLPYVSSYDVIITSRRLPDSKIIAVRSYTRELLSRIFASLAKMLVPTGVSDTQNGFKLFTAKAAETLFTKQTINGWAFDVEILLLAKRLGLRVKEVPVDWINGGHSRMTFSGALDMGAELLKISVKY